MRRLSLLALLLTLPAQAAEPPKVLALRPATEELQQVLGRSRWPGFVRDRLANQGWQLEVGPRGASPAEVEIEIASLPAPPAWSELVAGLPVTLGSEGVTLGGTAYTRRGIVAAFRSPRPPCPGCQRWLVVGRDPGELADFAYETALGAVGLSRRRSGTVSELDYRVRESPWLERTGRWRAVGEGWGIDSTQDRDAIGRRDSEFARLVPHTATAPDAWVRLLVPPGQEGDARWAPLVAQLERDARAMAPRVPLTALERPITIALEPDHETQGRNTGEVGPAVPGGPADLHLVWHPSDLGAYRVALAGALLDRAGLASGPPWLGAGAALWLAGEWYGRPYPEYLSRLAAAEVLPTAEELLASEEQGDSSRPLWTPVAAAWVERLPGETAREKLARVPGEPFTRAVLERIARDRASAVKRRPAPPSRFLAGASFAHDNSLEGGYHASGSRRQLERLAALGADAVALMPFGYQRDPSRPELGFLNRGATSENDAGMVHAARLARDQGFAVLWKPHLWLSHDSWPGEIEMTSEADWRSWWRSYRRFVVHHALLAEWGRADLFSVGVELDRTVRRESDWAGVVAAVRQFYSGPVTYAANWGEGSENVTFWHHLDVAGVDAYYPLASRDATSTETLELGAREVVAKLRSIAERAKLPLVLTEVGFPARRAAWSDPHHEDGELSEGDQERAYRALVPALQGQPWLRGAFFWKVFSGGWRGSSERPDFQFLGRPAERWVSAFWRAEKGS